MTSETPNATQSDQYQDQCSTTEELFDLAHSQLAHNTFKKLRLQRTFDLIAQGLIVGFVGILIWYNWLMFSPHLTPLLFAILFVVLLYKPLQYIQRFITAIDDKISDMKLKIYLTFFVIYVLLLVTSTLSTIIASSTIFAVTTFVLFGDRRAVSAIILLTILCIAFGLPSYYTIVTCVNESTELAVRIQDFVQENPEFQTLLDDFGNSTYYRWANDYAKQWGVELPQYNPQIIKDKIVELSMNFTNVFTDALGSLVGVLSSSLQVFIHLITFISSLYYFLVHAESISAILPDLSPFSEEDSNILMESLHSSVVQIFLSSFLIFITHLTGSYIIFSLTNIELTLVLSVLAGFTSVLPILGSYIIWIPVVIVKLIMGQHFQAIIITIVQLVLQFPVDLAIYSIIPGNAFLVAFSLAMGMYIFGFLGILLGPLLAGILVTVINMYAVYQRLPRLKIKDTEIEIDLSKPTPTLSLSTSPSNRSSVSFSGLNTANHAPNNTNNHNNNNHYNNHNINNTSLPSAPSASASADSMLQEYPFSMNKSVDYSSFCPTSLSPSLLQSTPSIPSTSIIPPSKPSPQLQIAHLSTNPSNNRPHSPAISSFDNIIPENEIDLHDSIE